MKYLRLFEQFEKDLKESKNLRAINEAGAGSGDDPIARLFALIKDGVNVSRKVSKYTQYQQALAKNKEQEKEATLGFDQKYEEAVEDAIDKLKDGFKQKIAQVPDGPENNKAKTTLMAKRDEAVAQLKTKLGIEKDQKSAALERKFKRREEDLNNEWTNKTDKEITIETDPMKNLYAEKELKVRRQIEDATAERVTQIMAEMGASEEELKRREERLAARRDKRDKDDKEEMAKLAEKTKKWYDKTDDLAANMPDGEEKEAVQQFQTYLKAKQAADAAIGGWKSYTKQSELNNAKKLKKDATEAYDALGKKDFELVAGGDKDTGENLEQQIDDEWSATKKEWDKTMETTPEVTDDTVPNNNTEVQ